MIRKYLAVLRSSIRTVVEYPHTTVASLLSLPLIVLIMTLLWSSFLNESYEKMFYYFLLSNGIFVPSTLWIWSASNGFVGFIKGRDNQNIPLTRPLNPFMFYIIKGLGKELISMLAAFGFVVLTLLLLNQIQMLIRVIITIPLVFLITVFIAAVVYLVTSFSYWVYSIWGIRALFVTLMFVFNGGNIPLWILPDKFLDLIGITPFPYLGYCPVMFIMNGELYYYLLSIIMLIVWSILSFGIGWIIHEKGWKKFEAFGG